MPTTTTKTGKPSILDKMSKEKEMPVPTRGRGLAPETIAVRDELNQCMKDRDIRSFSDVTVDGKDDYARIVRNAANHVDFEVSTRYDKSSKKLYWGPKEVMDELAEKRINGEDES